MMYMYKSNPWAASLNNNVEGNNSSDKREATYSGYSILSKHWHIVWLQVLYGSGCMVGVKQVQLTRAWCWWHVGGAKIDAA